MPLYARAGIQEVWIVDLIGKVIECHTGPSEEGVYRHTERAQRRETLGSEALPGFILPVDAVLGRL